MIRPVAGGKVTTNFKDPVPGSTFGVHLGTDYGVPTGTQVLAPCDGTIIEITTTSGVGKQVSMRGEGYDMRFLHLSQQLCRVGDTVKQGTVIALSGNTGTASSGPHLHWDVRKAGTTWSASLSNYVNPESLITIVKEPTVANLTRQDIIDEYQVNRGAAPSEGEISAHLNGGTWRSLSLGFKKENADRRNAADKTISDLQNLLNTKTQELEQADDASDDLNKTINDQKFRIGELVKYQQVQANEIAKLQNQLVSHGAEQTISIKQAVRVLVQAFKDWIK